MDNIIIDRPERLDSDIEDFKIDAVEEEKNFTASRIRVCRDPRSEEPVIFYTQEMIRNFKAPHDPFGKRWVLKTFSPENAMAAADVTLERKFSDSILAHKKQIPDYSPLTDIHSDEMGLFLDEDTATYLSDVGINIDGLGEDFSGIETVSATPFMEEVAVDVGKLKGELGDLRNGLRKVQLAILDELGDKRELVSFTGDAFDLLLAGCRVSDSLTQRYLELKSQITGLETQLGQASSAVFSETVPRIHLPGRIDLSKFILPDRGSYG